MFCLISFSLLRAPKELKVRAHAQLRPSARKKIYIRVNSQKKTHKRQLAGKNEKQKK